MRLKYIGVFLIFISIFLFTFNPSITGATIGTRLTNSLNFFAAICFIIGLILVHYEHKERNYALEALNIAEALNNRMLPRNSKRTKLYGN